MEIRQQYANFSDISLECDAIFDKPYVTTIGELYSRTTSISYTKVISIHYQAQSKRDTTWKIEVNYYLFITRLTATTS